MSMSMQDWNEVLRELFYEYTNVNNRLNRDYFTFLKLQKLLTDAGFLTNEIPSRQLELLYHSETRHRPHMSFENFLNFLPRLAELKYNNIYMNSPKEALTELLENHFLPLYTEHVQPNKFLQVDLDSLTRDSRDLLIQVFMPLQDLYRRYFPWETAPSMKATVKLDKSQKSLHVFLKDFDICPVLVSKPALFKIWNDVVVCKAETSSLLPENKYDEGTCLTLSRFLFVIYLCSQIAYSQDSSPPADRLSEMLERMELARDNKKSHKPQTWRDSLTPSRSIIDSELCSPSVLNLDINNLEEQLETVHMIFQKYCSYGEPMNTTRLKSSKLMKLLRDSGLLKDPNKVESFDISTSRIEAEGLTKVDIDLIFSKLTGTYANSFRKKSKKGFGPTSYMSLQNSNSHGRMEFQEFLKVLELIAEKLYPGSPVEQGFLALLEQYILKIDKKVSNGNEYTQVLMEMLQDEDMVAVLGLAHQVMSPYFMYYADVKGFMNISLFTRFCRDFEIFPHVINKAKLLKFFYTLAGIHARTEVQHNKSVQLPKAPGQTEMEVIDQHLFVEALALIAADVPHADPKMTPAHRFCHLMERLSQSNGPSKVGKNLTMSQPTVRKSDLLTPFRTKYPDLFQYPDQRRPTFTDLMT